MAFSETIKINIRRKSHFQCCLCKSVGVEVHHIVPQEDGGSDLEENGAPLCPSCHEIFGSNPSKRKFIREARNAWYEICQNRFKPDHDLFLQVLDMLSKLPSKDDFFSLKSEIFSTITCDTINRNNSNPELLSTEDLIVRLFGVRSPRPLSQYGFFTIDELWEQYDGDAGLEMFDSFTQKFGSLAVKQLAHKILDELNVPVSEEISEGHLQQSIAYFYAEMFLLILHSDGIVEASAGESGSIIWRGITEKMEHYPWNDK